MKVIAKRVMCKGREHLNKTAQELIDEGGEGVIMRVVGSHYLPGRNPALVKLKVSFFFTKNKIKF
jgi:ATP-dependent DNA ligase